MPTECIYVSCMISEQTAISSPYIFNCMVFITETECVYCAVRAESLSMIQVGLSF
jgi:hypothetical protein